MKARAIACSLVGTAAVLAVVLVPEPVYSHKPITTNILFKNEIAQIFQRKCFQCHSDNNLSMSLTTYTEARPWARAIREEVLERNMPPWQAVPGYGHFSNDISLNTREKEIILSWADGGAPSGVLKAEESIPPVFVPPAPAWDHGTPDQVVPVTAGQLIPGGAAFEVKRFVVPTGLTSSKRVRAIALKQGDRRVVRYASFSDATTGRWLGAWTPWQTSSNLADGVAIQLPAQAKIAVDVGYSGAEQDVTDKSELGLYFADGKSGIAASASFASPSATVTPGATGQRVRAETKLATDTRLLALWPNPGPGARSVEITATTPEGMLKPLLWIQDFRPAWRSPYLFSSPELLPAGTRVVMTAYFDNPGGKASAVRAETWMLTAPARQGPSTATGARPVAAPRK
jgi:hypothetical protein